MRTGGDHVVDDLRDLVQGDVLADDLTRAAYSTDASLFQVRPRLVVAPRSVEEIAAVVRYAAETGLSIHPRGAGTGLAGESLGPGIVIDVAQRLNRIVQTGANTVRVEAGVRWADLQDHLSPRGRMFAPDPLSGATCTIGGMLATDAGGPHSLRYGTTRDHVLRLRLVLADGRIVDVGRESVVAAAEEEEPLPRLVREAAAVLEEHEADILREQPATLPKPGGYCLRGVLQQRTVDLPRLLCGSEGTLAVIVEAVLNTLHVPLHRGLMLAFFANLGSAAGAVAEILDTQPTACEMLDRRLLAVVRPDHAAYRKWIPESAEAMLLVEQEGSSADNLADRLETAAKRIRSLALSTVRLTEKNDVALGWNVVRFAAPRLAKANATSPPLDFVESSAVPPAMLPGFLRRVQGVMQKHDATAAYTARAGVGLLHVRPLLDLRRPEQRLKLQAVTDDMLTAVLDFGGSCAAEHGAGLSRSGLLPRQFPRLYPAFRRIKAVFDPRNLLNPGKIVGAPLDFPVGSLRGAAVRLEKTVVPAELVWLGGSSGDMASQCSGCAGCRTMRPELRMCPSFKAHQSEMSGPRARVNLFRQIVSGELDPKLLSTDAYRKTADYCVNCKMCKVECPSGVDVSKLMLEAKAANVAEHGLPRGQAFFANLHSWSKWAGGKSRLMNVLLASPPFRWFAERVYGVSRQRRLPRYSNVEFLRRAEELGWTRKPSSNDSRPKVAFFADTFVRFFDPDLGVHAVKVLQHHDHAVYVPPQQVGSGMSAVHYGDLETARAALKTNLGAFTELAKEDYTVVTAEPTAALFFRQDALDLSGAPEVNLVASKTFEFSEYLAVLAERGLLKPALRSLMPATVAYHEPCHQRALGARADVTRAFSALSGLTVLPVDLGCSGMAGTFGLTADGFAPSMQAGEPLLTRLSQSDVQFALTQCSSCRLQIEQGAGRRTLHPAHWFAMAYGLAENAEALLTPPRQGLLA